MGSFVLAMTGMIVWGGRRLLNKGLEGLESIQQAIKTTNDAIWALKIAVEENTNQFEEHRKTSAQYVERLSREITNNHRRKT